MIATWSALVCLAASPLAAQLPVIRANHNDRPAGAVADGVLTLHLAARAGLWHPEAENGIGIPVQAFAEEIRSREQSADRARPKRPSRRCADGPPQACHPEPD